VGIVVQKFGGQLLGTATRIKRAAAYICATKDAGADPVVVVSAPGRSTDHFIKLAHKISEKPDPRELDMLVSVGERMGMSLMAMAINDLGRYRAVSFTGSQVGIITDNRHTDASIIEVKGYRIREAVADGMIPIVAGFQGISIEKEITTLGRGGSDATAVALAAAVGAERCELVKETGGIFSADPMLVSDARLHTEIDYATLEVMTAAGAKVIQPRAAGLAREHNVILAITAPDGRRGTLVSDRTLAKSAISVITLQVGFSISPLFSGDDASSYEIFSLPAGAAGMGLSTKGGHQTCDLVTVVGWGGKLPAEAVKTVLEYLEPEPLACFKSPGSLMIAFQAGFGRSALQNIHTRAIEAGHFDCDGSGGADY